LEGSDFEAQVPVVLALIFPLVELAAPRNYLKVAGVRMSQATVMGGVQMSQAMVTPSGHTPPPADQQLWEHLASQIPVVALPSSWLEVRRLHAQALVVVEYDGQLQVTLL
jgi:hypothetical protein